MKILWLTWKDLKNPEAGGAEKVNEEIAARLVKDGHEVKFVVANFKGGKSREVVSGYEVNRVGGKISLYLRSRAFYRRNLYLWPDLVIEEVNTIPFFSQYYVEKPIKMLFHQLCREVWFYQMVWPLNYLGYYLEPLYLKLLKKNETLTISDSSKQDLIKYGFGPSQIKLITMGSEIEPVLDLSHIKKYPTPTMLSLGAIRPMKRPDVQIEAFEIAKKTIPGLKLKIAGGGVGKYYNRVLKQIEKSPYRQDIEFLGRVTLDKKIELMQRCHFIAVTSVKEGWGLIVTEANSQGTPAVVYNVDGLRDSTHDGKTGFVCREGENTPEGLAKLIIKICKLEPGEYDRIRDSAWRFSKSLSFDAMYQSFLTATSIVKPESLVKDKKSH